MHGTIASFISNLYSFIFEKVYIYIAAFDAVNILERLRYFLMSTIAIFSPSCIYHLIVHFVIFIYLEPEMSDANGELPSVSRTVSSNDESDLFEDKADITIVEVYPVSDVSCSDALTMSS